MYVSMHWHICTFKLNCRIPNYPCRIIAPVFKALEALKWGEHWSGRSFIRGLSHLDQNVKNFFPCLWGEVVEVGKDSTHAFCNSNSYQDPCRWSFPSEVWKAYFPIDAVFRASEVWIWLFATSHIIPLSPSFYLCLHFHNIPMQPQM